MDKEAVKDGLLGIATHYAGPGKQGGVRVLFRCPHCGKPDKFAANPSRSPKIVGCLNGNCPVPKVMDALDVVAYFERLDLSRDWGRVLTKGYEILGLAPSDERRQAPHRRNGADTGTETSREDRTSPLRARPRVEPDDRTPKARTAFPENLSGVPALRGPSPAEEYAGGEQDEQPNVGEERAETDANGREVGEGNARASHPKGSN